MPYFSYIATTNIKFFDNSSLLLYHIFDCNKRKIYVAIHHEVELGNGCPSRLHKGIDLDGVAVHVHAACVHLYTYCSEHAWTLLLFTRTFETLNYLSTISTKFKQTTYTYQIQLYQSCTTRVTMIIINTNSLDS